MKKFLVLIFSSFLVINSCSKDAPLPTVNTFTLSVTASEGGSLNPSSGTYNENSSVTITAAPSAGFQFTGWSGDGSGNDNPLTVTMTGNKSITATFSRIQYTLNVGVVGQGSVSQELTSAAKTSEEYNSGDVVRLTARPENGWVFNSWSGSSTETINEIDVAIDGTKSVTATFKQQISYEYNQLEINEPPFYSGTIFESGDIITSSDPSLFSEIEYKGTGQREMYDRRNGGAYIDIEAYIFDTGFSDGLKTEIQINPEFTLEEANAEANKYAFLIGQLPTLLRQDVQTMWIHRGYEGYGGGSDNLLIHTGMTETYENYLANGEGDPSIVEEVLIHEATHTSIDYHYESINAGYGDAWVEAVNNDNWCYISNYAQQYPYREDVAEIMLMYVAVRYFPERITTLMRDQILSCNLNRINHLDSLNLDMSLYEN